MTHDLSLGLGRVAALAAHAIALLATLGVLASAEAAPPGPPADPLLEPAAMNDAVSFWMRVYLEVTTEGGLLHDSRHLAVVYETLRFGDERGRRARERTVTARKRHWRQVLRDLGRGREPANEAQTALVQMMTRALGHEPKSKDFNAAARRIRFQLGQRDKFRDGLIRSGAYEAEMRAIFRDLDLPEDLAYLPHVESSFNVRAYSKYGAAGVWQFMRSTGRRYMTVDYVVDERLDPMVATRAAARLLRDNYKSLESWPLAVTAYNHGAAGMRRARRKLGTSDLPTIIKRYRSRTFGFASRNFYAQFLAARRVVRSYESYFGPLARSQPNPVDEASLPFFADVDDVERHLGVSRQVVRDLNPALRPPVFRSGKRIPKGYRLRLPAGTTGGDAETWLAAIPEKRRFGRQHRSAYYKVRRGDTLSQIAKRNRTSISTLVAINNLPSRHRIYPGQVLQLPDAKGRPPTRARAGLVRTARAATPPAPEPPAKPAEPATPAPSTEPAPKAEAEPEPEPVAVAVAVAVAKLGASAEPAATAQAAGPPTRAQASRPPSPDANSRFRRVSNDRVVVDTSETLGHFADWLEVPTQRLRDLNGMRMGRKLHMGQRIRLDLSRVPADTFVERRLEYHKAIEEDFFGSYRVTGTVEHSLRRGESLWLLSHKVYSVPTWLIQRYNPDTDLTRLQPGASVHIPVVERQG